MAAKSKKKTEMSSSSSLLSQNNNDAATVEDIMDASLSSPTSTNAVKGVKPSGSRMPRLHLQGLVKSGWLSSIRRSKNKRSSKRSKRSTRTAGGGGGGAGAGNSVADDASSVYSTPAASIAIDDMNNNNDSDNDNYNDNTFGFIDENNNNNNNNNNNTSSSSPALVTDEVNNNNNKNPADAATATATAAAAAATTSGGLDLVVLLMDPISHRFELLQLEFDVLAYRKAKVSDLLQQIPLSVTEPCLQTLTFDGILDHNDYYDYYYNNHNNNNNNNNNRIVIANGGGGGRTTTTTTTKKTSNNSNGHSNSNSKAVLLPSSILMEAFCPEDQKSSASTTTTKMVLVARPEGISDAETLRMAKPILTNKDVSKMLELSGFDVSGWKSKKFSSRASSQPVDKNNDKDKANKTTTTNNNNPNNNKPLLNSEYIQKKNDDDGSLSTGGGKHTAAADDDDDSKTEDDVLMTKNSSTAFCLLGLVFAWIIGSLAQSVMIQPIPSGVVLKPGTYKSKCGLFGYYNNMIPISSSAEWKETTKHMLEALLLPLPDFFAAPDFLSCQDEFLYVSRDGTTVTLYDSNHDVTMILTGGDLCSSSSSNSSNNKNGNQDDNENENENNDNANANNGNSNSNSKSCVDGLVMNGDDKTLEMGGKTIKQVLVQKSHRLKKLSPWPFEEEPTKLRYKIGSTKALSSL